MYGGSPYGYSPYGSLSSSEEVMFDALVMTDTLSYTRASKWADTLLATSSFSPKTTYRMIVSDSLKAATALLPARSYRLTDALHAASTFTPRRSYSISDSLDLSEQYTPRVSARALIDDVLTVASVFVTARVSLIIDHITAVSALKTGRSLKMVEAAHTHESYLIRSILKGSMRESLTASDVMSALVNARGVISDSLCADDMYVIPGNKAGLSAPTDRFGMSRYDDLLVDEIAMLDDTLVGVGSAGVYSLDAQTDNGAAINSSITTSKWDQLKPVMKRPGYMYIGAEFSKPISSAKMSLAVTHWQDGPPKTIVVPVEPHVSGGMVSMRFKMPPVRSFYFQYTLSSNGGVWTLDDMRSAFDILSRRV